jgi:murein L,D-transpeptidase YafK
MRQLIVLTFILILSACVPMQDLQKRLNLPFDLQAVFGRLDKDLKQKQVMIGDPVFIRIFKEENELELWMKADDNTRYTLIKTYPICNWSGGLGPKFYEGDRQSPEGFYQTTLQSLKPDSQYHLAFNIEFPNAYDVAYGRTGSFIMVHGDCVSEGCYAMTDPQMEEIYTLVERALDAGQKSVPVHVFPFKMTSERMFFEYKNKSFNFWMNLRDGYDYFEQNGIPPLWVVNTNKQYEFF